MASISMKTKKGNNVIHRTTSETLRLADDVLNLNSHNQLRLQTSCNRKKPQPQATSPSCSFQITGVLTRYDLEDESADDLDESHTDDISRVTDNETPSFSEDSRDIDDHLQIQQGASVYNQNLSPQTKPEVVEIPAKPKDEEKPDLDDLGRFRVVKLESVVPFSRGRWTCFDYIDEAIGNKQEKPLKVEVQQDKNQKPPATCLYWEPNCQQTFLYTGSILMPEPIPIYLPIPVRPPRMKRTSCPVSTNVLPAMVRPRLVRPNFMASQSFDGGVNSTTLMEHEKIPYLRTMSVKTKEVVNVQVQSMTTVDNNTGASVSCTATIDTKIEHALDVVKNHLTHAVRLEVEELKIKIKELVERISYLEYENDLLRANVAPNVLATLGNNTAK